MNQNYNENDAACTVAVWSKPVKRFTALPGSLFKSFMFPVRLLNHWDRDGGFNRFIRKWYFGNF